MKNNLLLMLLVPILVCSCRHTKFNEPETQLQAKTKTLMETMLSDYEFAAVMLALAVDNEGDTVINFRAVGPDRVAPDVSGYTLGPLVFPVLLSTFDSLPENLVLPVGCDSLGTVFVVDDHAVFDYRGTTSDSLPVCDALAEGSKVAFSRLCHETFSNRSAFLKLLKRSFPDAEWPSAVDGDSAFVSLCSGNVKASLPTIVSMMSAVRANKVADSVLCCASVRNGLGSTLCGMTCVFLTEKECPVAVFGGYTNKHVIAMVAVNTASHPSFLREMAQEILKEK